MNIPFNKPYLSGKETHYIYDAVNSGKISGNGKYTQKCQQYFVEKYGFKKALLTTSCTDALEMCAILANIKAGDEVIVPSFTFVSTAIAFVRQGAKIVFADSSDNNPNIDAEKLEALITEKTKAIIPVHYAGVACDMDKIMGLAAKYNLLVIEDAAQAIDSYYTGKDGVKKALGSIGHMAAFSFHETKNIISGEGGMLTINDSRFINRAEIIWEKGTNRAEFFRGEVNKYGWVDTGSSFLPSEIIAAFLWAQIENLEEIQSQRKLLWNAYYNGIQSLNKKELMLPYIPNFATNNGHMFYLICSSEQYRSELILQLKEKGIHAVFHYISLHSSDYYNGKHDGRSLMNSDNFTSCLVRLPMYFDLSIDNVKDIVEIIKSIK
ncbi:dTDP-4-amino-4,6-dideoxygalactose transaminase [Flavobacterium sp.]|uniref:dTDP-4-amino-4,6-dideoxygalactose transaminase n=1 Tax=Flavobacterium sp. TaxID=239 RepID=UPI001B48D210|nr:dTDP-4-amino-4,6-dideoxygalactose transaminase [Flavobacterium sp.]MBP6128163.1 dTDP-4-amino-4,6-dideoxygalactose transaminase [Flavobacterium sp.]